MMDVAPQLRDAVDELVYRPADEGLTLALLVLQGGEPIAEWYGIQPANEFQPESKIGPESTLISWSMAKSITHAAVAILVDDGALDLEAPAPVPGWAGTPKEEIRLIDLLEMRSGLRFVEDYIDGESSHCIEMLFGSGADDHAAYAAALPLDHPPGTVWNYSSGTTNIISRIISSAVGGGADGMRAYLRDRLFDPAGMKSAEPKFDNVGTWVGSSYVFATARDFARFGELYRNDGELDGRRVLLPGWTDHARHQVALDPETGHGYGRHWWTWPTYSDSVVAHGYEGQVCAVIPDQDLVLVHLGKTDATVAEKLRSKLHRIVDAAV
jgi:CubicO group peptidase (beta-lactamase class C family)